MPGKNLYSATEIAKMRLPGLPTSKNRVIELAAQEAWYFEERKGMGGRLRRVYQIPDRYVTRSIQQAMPVSDKLGNAEVVVKSDPDEKETPFTGEEADTQLIELAVRSVEEWLQGKGVQLEPKRTSAIVALLYDYLYAKKTTDTEDIQRFLRAIVL